MDPNQGSDDPVPAYAVVPDSPELAGTKNPKKRYVRNKMDPSSTCVDSALEALALCDEEQWTPIKTGLDFLRTFLTFIPQWTAVADEAVRKPLGDLLGRIEDAFEKAGWDIEDAIEKGDPDNLVALRCSLQEKIDRFKPRIGETYDFLSEYVFRTTHPPVISGSDVWSRLYGFLLSNSQNLHCRRILTTSLYEQFEHIFKFLLGFKLREVIFKYPSRFKELCTQHGGVAICFARLLFSLWVEGNNEAEDITVTVILSNNLLKRIMPTSPSLMAMYFKAIKSQRFSLQKTLVEELVGLTLLRPKGSLETLFDGLVYLMKHLMELPEKLLEDEEIRRSSIERVICDAVSLSDENDGMGLDQLVQKVEHLKLEILLIELGEGDSISKTRFESTFQGERFHDAYTEKLMLILHHVEALAYGAESLNDSLKASKSQEGRLCDIPYVKVSLDFYLTEFHAFLMEIMRGSPSLIVRVKDQIQMLSEGSKLFYKYSSILPLKNPSDMELMLTYMDGAVKDAAALHDFYHANQVTEHKIKEMSLLLSKFLERFTLLNAKMKESYHQFQSSAMLALPKTLPGLGFVDFYLERVSGLMKCEGNSVGHSIKHQTEAVLTELGSLRSVLKQVGEKQSENPELKEIHNRVTLLAYQADYIIDSILLLNGDGSHMLWLSEVIEEMKLIRAELMNSDFTTGGIHSLQTSRYMITSAEALETQEFIVPLDDQEEEIINRLTRGSSKRREIVTIVGMAGIGKTTLARKVYKNPVVKKHFKSLAWCCFSKEYRTREVLLKILSDITRTADVVQEGNDDLVKMLYENYNKSDQDLVEMLRKKLKGKNFLVVVDDVWSIEAWKEIEGAFPDDSYGNRILFTSRFDKVALEAQRDGAHPLRFLTEEESWNLLQRKVFGEDKCPKELTEAGQAIAKSCNQLPLAVVTIAGLLKRTEKDVDRWNQIKEDLHSRILDDPESQCELILELSYNHLPDDLKPCFLYFAAFVEDYEVPVQKLIRLWIAEGFIRKIDQSASALLEDVAEGYVMDLIGRSLLMAAKKGSNGRVKTCKVHDMLHNLCLKKVEEESFLKSITGYEKLLPSSTGSLDYGVESIKPLNSESYEKYRLSISSRRKDFVMLEPSGPPVRTLLFFATNDTYPTYPYDVSFIPRNFKLLRVLDIESINLSSFPEGIVFLDPLRYLTVSGHINSVPSTIEKLWNLETFVVRCPAANINLPETIWSMRRLRHLHVNNGAVFKFPDENHEIASRLDNLVTLSSPVLFYGEDAEKIMKKFPELKKLRCTFSPVQQRSENSTYSLVFDLIIKLESLKILYKGNPGHFCEFRFPPNLQKLSLSGFSLTWDCISVIGALEKLKVLSLDSITFDGPKWEMRDDEFRELRSLKLVSLEIEEWIASSEHLISLERLVLRRCKQLQEVPSDFGEIYTLKMIELLWCSTSAESSLKTIEDQQQDANNSDFKTIINDPAAVGFTSSL